MRISTILKLLQTFHNCYQIYDIIPLYCHLCNLTAILSLSYTCTVIFPSDGNIHPEAMRKISGTLGNIPWVDFSLLQIVHLS